MNGCSKHDAPVKDCVTCTRVGHAREQLELASGAEPHVDWNGVASRLAWRQTNAVQVFWPWNALKVGVLTLLVLGGTFYAIKSIQMGKTVAKRVEVPAKLDIPKTPDATPAHTTFVTGDVRVASGKDWIPLVIGEILKAGAKLETELGHASLQWGDGTGAALADMTELELAKLDSLRTTIDLNRGEVTLRVSHRGDDQTFAVRTPGHEVEVRGTWFTVARNSGRTTVSVCEGKVVVRTRNGVEQATLERGQKASFRDGAILASTAADDKVSCLDPWLLQWQSLLQAAPLRLGGAQAELSLDGHFLGHSPMALLVTPGKHTLTIARLGLREMREITIAPGRGVEINIEKIDLRSRAREISDQVVAQKEDISKCYSRALKRDPTIQGTFKIRVAVAADGHVRHAEIFESVLADIDVESCITSAARGWMFPVGPAVTSETTLELQ